MYANEQLLVTIPTMEINENKAFSEAITYLYSFINLETKRHDRYLASKLDTTRIRRMLAALDSPHLTFPSIHIAGTKGKGSVAVMCTYCLRAAGLRVGLFTSPHLVDFRERIRILTPEDEDGRIPEDNFIQHLETVKSLLPDFPGATWFELVTILAFMHFAAEKVDIAVVEVGLGGRLDTTNVLTPLVSVITSLSLDHTKLLGDTLTHIAFEKGGIIKPGIPLVCAPQKDEALQKLEEIVAERNAPFILIGRDWQFHSQKQPNSRKQTLHIKQSAVSSQQSAVGSSFFDAPAAIPLNLIGEHQVENAMVAVAALNVVKEQFGVGETAVRHGLATVQWPGRLQILHHGNTISPMVLVDCAHNPDSALKLHQALIHDFTYNKLWFILGVPADKDVSGVLKALFPLAEGIIVTTANHPRSAAPEQLAQISAEHGFEATPASTMADAVQLARQQARSGDLICITGSIIVVGDLLNQWDSLQSVFTSV
ncbi:MAG: bifunctional folylpolyglutamate synthase/dihydrofolate synthase [Chloroflexi bacterium]|nr:MAG: bifunctional folylpolyglutamate synthase/dihydrofolate synthase [Chloroflexota bacterium]